MLFPIRLLHILTRTFLKYLRVLKHTTTEIEAKKKKNDCFFKGQVAGKLMKYYAPHREKEDDHSLLQTANAILPLDNRY